MLHQSAIFMSAGSCQLVTYLAGKFGVIHNTLATALLLNEPQSLLHIRFTHSA